MSRAVSAEPAFWLASAVAERRLLDDGRGLVVRTEVEHRGRADDEPAADEAADQRDWEDRARSLHGS